MANSVDPYQTTPTGAACSEFTLFASILNSSVMLGNICSTQLQQMKFTDALFSWRFKALNVKEIENYYPSTLKFEMDSSK